MKQLRYCLWLLLTVCFSWPLSVTGNVTTAAATAGGQATSVDINHGVPVPVPPRIIYSIQALPLPPTQERPWVSAINDLGQVVGSTFPLGNYQISYGILWTNGQPTVLPKLGGSFGTYPMGLNNKGVVVGSSSTTAQFQPPHAFIWTSTGGMRDINVGLAREVSEAVGISEAGQVLVRQDIQGRANWLIWTESGYNFLPLSGYRSIQPYAISSSGVIAAVAVDAQNFDDHPFIYANGVMTFLAGMGTPYAVNDQKESVGQSINSDGSLGSPAFWDAGGARRLLIDAPGTYGYSAYAINQAGAIVGTADDSNGSIAIYWRDATSPGVNLNTILTPEQAAEWQLTEADAINSWGQIAGVGSYQGSFAVFILTPQRIFVDTNRDGTIKLDESDATTATKPYRFWLNDDVDRKGVDPDEADVEDDDDPSGHSSDRDWMVDQIPCKRDLEDFARLWVYTQGLNTAFQSGDMKLGLKWTNITSGAPAIKLYREADTDGGTGYLFDPTIAQTQIDPAGAGKAIAMTPEGGGAAITVIEGANGFIFPKEVFTNLTDAQPKTYLLFEGCKKGAGQLQLVIYDKNGTKVGDGPGIYLDLKNIKEMYERWTVGDGPNPLIGQKGGGDPATTAAISTARLPSDVAAFQYGAQQTPDDKNYILFVHGWNMPPWLKDAWAETTFKRLYWQGYKGRFGTFQWPTTYHDWSALSVFDYDLGEHTAWRSAQPLADLLRNLKVNRSYTVSVLAHSMGNVVTGEALQVTGRSNRIDAVANYVATQAAAPGHCFDGSLAGGDLLSFGFLGFGSASTPNIYRDWFYLSSLVARAQANFYNVNDYALSGPVWQTDQTLKPDSVVGYSTGTFPNRVKAPYGYTGDPAAAAVKTGFFKTTYGPDANGNEVRTGTTSLSLEDVDANNGSVTNLRDRYEIMAFASQPRSKALGGVTTVAGFSPQSLQSLWPADTFPQTNGPYSAHPWHSAQFRFTNADQANYWNKFMKKLGLPTTQ